MNLKLNLVAIFAAVALSACGGGGGDPSPAPAPAPSIDGFWTDATSVSLITNTGELWSVEATSSGPMLLRGSVATTGSAFTGTITAYEGQLSVTGTIGGTFVPRASITGSTTVNGATGTYSLTYEPSYTLAPSLAAVAGTYSIQGGGAVTLAANGNLSGNRTGCAFTGQLTPDAGGRNFYRLALTFGASPCALAGATASGVVVNDGGDIVVGVVAGSAGSAFFASKN